MKYLDSLCSVPRYLLYDGCINTYICNLTYQPQLPTYVFTFHELRLSLCYHFYTYYKYLYIPITYTFVTYFPIIM